MILPKALAVPLVSTLFFGALFLVAHALSPDIVGLREGQLVGSSDASDPDIFVLNAVGYKRLFLNPVIFSFYGHLGSFQNVSKTSPGILESFPTSYLYRNCETNDPKVYFQEKTSEDVAVLRWVQLSAQEALNQDPYFFAKIFCINSREFRWYSQGPILTSVRTTPVPLPAPSPTPLAPDTSTWPTYQNSHHRFSFRHPNIWEASERTKDLVLFNSNSSRLFDLAITARDAEAISSLRSYWQASPAPVAEKLSDVTIGSLSGLKITSSYGSTLLLLKGGLLYTFASGTQSGKDNFDALLKTISFE